MTIATQNIEAANLGGLDLSCPYCGDTSLTTPSGRVFDIGTPYAKAHNLERDHRTLKMAGLKTDSRLEVFPLVAIR